MNSRIRAYSKKIETLQMSYTNIKEPDESARSVQRVVVDILMEFFLKMHAMFSISKFYVIGGTGVSWSENCIFPYGEVNTHILVFFFCAQQLV